MGKVKQGKGEGGALKHTRSVRLTPFLAAMGFFLPMREGFTSVSQEKMY